jgi:DNA-binding PadR family transcriptional regulator
MAKDLFAQASLFVPTEPETLESLDIPFTTIEGLILRLLHIQSVCQGTDMTTQLCLPFFGVLEPILTSLRDQRLVEITKGEGMSPMSYYYGITDAGRGRAMQYFEQTTYVGPAPISVESYTAAILSQTLGNVQVNAERLRESFEGLVFDEEILEQVGPAVNSGKSIFLYGPPGNGKTSICERIVKSFGGSIFVPHAIEVNGQIIKYYDAYNHQPVLPGEDMRLDGRYDRRYQLIHRPIIIVGGELNLAGLDLIWNNESRYYEAPFQLKSNGGAFMIDDFGRQRMEPKTLLNRWIIPLEKRIDFLTLHTGTKIEVPFDQLIVFSTNLNPKDLVDDAFLRRIRYKIPINNPSTDNFKKIWEIVSKVKNLPYDPQIPEYFIEQHLKTRGRPCQGCLPRDILEYVLDVCRYKQIDATIDAKMLDDAANAYFVKFDENDYRPMLG